MNKEKLNTALEVFVKDFREWLPAKLSQEERQQLLKCTSPQLQKEWNNRPAAQRKTEDLIDIAPLRKLAQEYPDVLRSFWEGPLKSLQDALEVIAHTRNQAAHHSDQLQPQAIEATFAALRNVLKGFDREEAAQQIQTLHAAHQSANAATALQMTATWKKQVQAESALIYLEIEYAEKRTDIQEFLRAFEEGRNAYKGDHADLVHARLIDYFTAEKLIENGKLSEKGKRAKDSGQVTAKEAGKYRIWWLPSAPLLQGCIVYFERQRPDNNQDHAKTKAQHRNLQLRQDQHFRLSTDKKHAALSFQITQSGNKNLEEDLVEAIRGTDHIQMTWRWTDLDHSQIYLNGQLSSGKDSLGFAPQPIAMPVATAPFLQQLFPAWKQHRQRLGCKADELSPAERKAFLKDFAFSKQLDFDQIEFKHVPLMPNDLVEAKRWQDLLLVDGLAAQYLGKEAWQALCDSYKAHPAFLDYQLDNPSPDEFLSDYYGKTNAAQREADFWHLAAPFDLFPNLNA